MHVAHTPSTLDQGFNITLTVLPSTTWQGQEGHQRGASGAGEGAGVALHHYYLVSPASHRILHQLAQLPPPWVGSSLRPPPPLNLVLPMLLFLLP